LEQLVVAPTSPDLIFILDVPAAWGLVRADARTSASRDKPQMRADPFQARSLAFHEQLRRGFLDLAAADPKRRVVISATETVEQVANEIWSEVAMRFKIGCS
jgi:dTMP kinase